MLCIIFFRTLVFSPNSQEGFEKNSEYRQLLVRTLHHLAVKFHDVASVILPQLMEFLSDSDEKAIATAVDVISFVREAFERLSNLRSDMLSTLLSSFSQITAASIIRATAWIIGEYANTPEDIVMAINAVKCVKTILSFTIKSSTSC